MSRFGFIHHPESVTLVVVDGDELVLVRQSRPGAPGTRTLELPAGSCEPGETPAEAAARELAEECGLAAASLRPIGSFYVVPAYSSELTHVYEATGLSPASAESDEDEDITLERRPVGQTLRALSDAGSIAALALWLGQAAGASQSST
ncbi:MAG: NUDIX hydrolase [Gaiellales bacterium]